MVKGFGVVNKAEVGVLLELSCFFYDPADAGNLISGGSTTPPQTRVVDSYFWTTDSRFDSLHGNSSTYSINLFIFVFPSYPSFIFIVYIAF